MQSLSGKAWGPDFRRRIRSECFRIHSVFNTVCNLQSAPDQPLLALVTREEAQGPNTLWLGNLEAISGCMGSDVVYAGNCLYCTGVKLVCGNASLVPLHRATPNLNLTSLEAIETWLELQFPGITQVSTRIHNLCRALQSQDLDLTAQALQGLIGCGEGLTPSGDDYVAGVLVSFLRGWDGSRSDFAEKLPGIVAVAAQRTTEISRTMLWYAARGEGAYYLTRAADGLLSAGPRTMQHVLRLSRIGSSSGRYLLAGLLQGCKIFLARENRNLCKNGLC